MGCRQTTAVTAVTADMIVFRHLQQHTTVLPLSTTSETQLYVGTNNLLWKICTDQNPIVLQQLHRNTTVMMALPSSPYILAPIACEQLSDHVLCTCMPYARTDLFEWIQTPFDWDIAEQYLKEVAHGLCWLHRMGFGHGDVKPENIVLGAEHAMLIDFDFTVPFNDWCYSGTLHYNLPLAVVRQWTESNSVKSRRMDVYAYGKTILSVLYAYRCHRQRSSGNCWLYETWIPEMTHHDYVGQQKMWADVAFQCCRRQPPTQVPVPIKSIVDYKHGHVCSTSCKQKEYKSVQQIC